MKSTLHVFLMALTALGLLASTGCSGKNKGTGALDPSIKGGGGLPPLPPGMTDIGGTPGIDDLPANLAEITDWYEVPELVDKTVYFSYDSSELGPSERYKVEAAVAWLAANPSRALRVEGHCDERGSNDYNIALGERRALSVRNYMIDLGADASRLTTTSLGEEFPADFGHTEAAWRQNRRAVFSAH